MYVLLSSSWLSRIENICLSHGFWRSGGLSHKMEGHSERFRMAARQLLLLGVPHGTGAQKDGSVPSVTEWPNLLSRYNVYPNVLQLTQSVLKIL